MDLEFQLSKPAKPRMPMKTAETYWAQEPCGNRITTESYYFNVNAL